MDKRSDDPDHIVAKLPFLEKRNHICARIREFFTSRHFLEVETPYVVDAPGEEVHLLPFRTHFETIDGKKYQKFLHTSPEFAMKRIVAAIKRPIFQFARVWRNGEKSPCHNPEFTMLEWYSPHLSFEGLIRQTEELIQSVMPSKIIYNHNEITLNEAFEKLTVEEAFKKYVHIDIFESINDVEKLAKQSGYKRRHEENWEDLYFRIFLEKIEPHLGKNKPTFLTHWPKEMAALAKRDPSDLRRALRFELYIGGLELTNGFEELTDPIEQRTRFERDRKKRQQLYKDRPQWELDEPFLRALAHLPACSGNALGFDRLVMLGTQAPSIKDVLWL